MRQSDAGPRTKRQRRFAVCFCAAGALHAASLLWRFEQHAPVPSLAALDLGDLVSIALEPPAVAPAGAVPGGGSPVPDPRGTEHAAPELPVQTAKRAPKVPLAPERVERPEVSESAPDSDDTQEAAPSPDLLLASAGETLSVRPRAARSMFIAARNPPSATAPKVSAERGATSHYQGYGPGANGGPGGPGRGSGRGVVTKAFEFGGPTGAFRADVCAIPEDTSSVREVKACNLLATFFTDTLNVTPRKFRQGFPGVTERTEWFAILYHGKFQVTAGDYYRFRLLSDDGAILYVDGHQIIDNDGQHAPLSRQITIQLEAGQHDLYVAYYQGPREDLALQLFVQPSNGPERLLGPKL